MWRVALGFGQYSSSHSSFRGLWLMYTSCPAACVVARRRAGFGSSSCSSSSSSSSSSKSDTHERPSRGYRGRRPSSGSGTTAMPLASGRRGRRGDGDGILTVGSTRMRCDVDGGNDCERRRRVAFPRTCESTSAPSAAISCWYRRWTSSACSDLVLGDVRRRSRAAKPHRSGDRLSPGTSPTCRAGMRLPSRSVTIPVPPGRVARTSSRQRFRSSANVTRVGDGERDMASFEWRRKGDQDRTSERPRISLSASESRSRRGTDRYR